MFNGDVFEGSGHVCRVGGRGAERFVKFERVIIILDWVKELVYKSESRILRAIYKLLYRIELRVRVIINLERKFLCEFYTR